MHFSLPIYEYLNEKNLINPIPNPNSNPDLTSTLNWYYEQVFFKFKGDCPGGVPKEISKEETSRGWPDPVIVESTLEVYFITVIATGARRFVPSHVRNQAFRTQRS